MATFCLFIYFSLHLCQLNAYLLQKICMKSMYVKDIRYTYPPKIKIKMLKCKRRPCSPIRICSSCMRNLGGNHLVQRFFKFLATMAFTSYYKIARSLVQDFYIYSFARVLTKKIKNAIETLANSNI